MLLQQATSSGPEPLVSDDIEQRIWTSHRHAMLSLSHTHTRSRTVVDRSEQGLIPAAGTCACVCVSKHLGRLPLHRPTGTSGSDSNNGSNAGGGGMGGGAIRNARLVPASLSPLVRDTHNLRHRRRQDLSTAPSHYPVFLNPVGVILQTGHFSTRTLILSVCVLTQKIHEGVLLYLQKCILFFKYNHLYTHHTCLCLR